MSTQPSPAPPSTGMWAQYEPPEVGEKLTELEKIGPFVLLGVAVREGIQTQHGVRSAADLRVQTTEKGETRLFSGFSSGIVGQCRHFEGGNLPAVVQIKPRVMKNGTTTELELVRLIPPGAEVDDIARHLTVPLAPAPPAAVAGDDIPY